jgi:hypothetical protein
MSADRRKTSVGNLRDRLKVKSFDEKNKLYGKFPSVKTFFEKKGLDLSRIREHSAKIIGTGAIVGSLMLLPPNDGEMKFLPTPSEVLFELEAKPSGWTDLNTRKVLLDAFESILPEKPRPLSRSEEKLLERIFDQVFDISARASLESEHLNTTYGYMGIEQHLRRYPGDQLSFHGTVEDQKEGIAPGLGAWGYFAESELKMNEDLVEKERWYVAVQTLYLPDWNKRFRYLRDWYKYRKVLVVNTENGNAIVADVADSGPAAWTGKQFGGSPEVMRYLGGPNFKKGKVLVFFVDDPNNTVKLGPVNYRKL